MGAASLWFVGGGQPADFCNAALDHTAYSAGSFHCCCARSLSTPERTIHSFTPCRSAPQFKVRRHKSFCNGFPIHTGLTVILFIVKVSQRCPGAPASPCRGRPVIIPTPAWRQARLMNTR